ncbi:MAG TPA: exo-beta-N-acetylmuramidase NamZ domain-containing protein [Terriglobales bacterium]|nr:exo-beta-N-acetylmuramidase NamZ domain-containing protein [Terriglobales bacterium]
MTTTSLRKIALGACVLLAAANAFSQPFDSRLSVADSIIQETIDKHEIPGAVLLVGHDGQVVYRKAYGMRSLEPARSPMTVATIFDMASLTKVVATTTAVMQLVEEGKVRLNDSVAKYIPEFAQNGKNDIAVRDLMTHYSGLPPSLDLKSPWSGRETGYSMAFGIVPFAPPESRFVYSDVDYIVLGAVVERVTGMALDSYCAQNIFVPLAMTKTAFRPQTTWLPEIAPTEYDERGQMLRGVVHDPTVRRMGGVAGQAGLFSTADDLAKFAQALLSGSSVLSWSAIQKMTTPQQPANASTLRGLGWDIDSPMSHNRGELLPVGSFGHTGFTGTSIWIDPTTNTYVILLTNAVHPRGQGTAISLRSKVATAVAAALNLTPAQSELLRWKAITGYNESMPAQRRVANRNGSVLTGIDVLEAQDFAALKGKRVGLLTNQTGLDASGRRTIDVLAHASGVQLTTIFSPEHGVTGTLDTTKIGNSRDAATGIPILSVYGPTDAARRPTPETLRNLDAIAIDIQDAGVRFYTYETTLGYFLEAAAKAGIAIFVLDRPNPLMGAVVQGPMSEPGRENFTNYGPIPVRHGMTLGELAQMFNAEHNIHAKLTVVPMQGWMRGDWFDETGLAWMNPSPNLRSLNEAILYPGVALVEGTNVSVGRGTDTPFEVLGAPWINARELSSYLNLRQIPGARFVPLSFTPTSSNYSGQECHGVNIFVTGREFLDSPQLGLELASALHTLYPEQFHMEKMAEIVANENVLSALMQGKDPRGIELDWQDELQKFQQLRDRYLIYK